MEKIFISIIRLLCTFFFLDSFSPKQSLAIGNNNTDYKSLVAFKNHFLKQSNGDSYAIFMTSWNDSNNFCSWEGITCSHRHLDRVTALDLSSSGLAGPLPPSIANLTFLKRIDLSNNSLYGNIRPNLASLPRLQHLNLSFNLFHGGIQDVITTNNSVFQVLDLGNNQLTGKIPPFINSLSYLNFLGLDNNHIIGNIPPSFGNLSLLKGFYALGNHLQGSIPPEIGGLRKLEELKLAENNLSGDIPHSLYNLSAMCKFSVASNQLSGKISTNIAQAFPYLKGFLIGFNHFTGSLIQALQNVTSLIFLDVGINNFTGVLPPNLGRMHNLVGLNLEYNELEANDAEDWKFLDSLTNCTSLEFLHLHANNFGGMLPKSIRNLSSELQMLTFGSNYISRNIPFELDRYTKLIALGMEENILEGPIPESIGKLRRLQFLSFEVNRLTGTIPNSLGNLTILNTLGLGFNQLTGSIPLSLKNLQVLTKLDLSHNKLTSSIPGELFLIASLSDKLDLSFNSFTGTLPLEIDRLINLIFFDFSNNNLIGEIPESLGSCQSLLKLNMEYNLFHGSIPISLANIKYLETLDLSHNNLSGVIPQSLQNLTSLRHLNLSFNNLEGEVPYEGVFANSSSISLTGNDKLCGGIPKLHLPTCIAISSSEKRSHYLIKILIPILIIPAILLILSFCYILLYRKQTQNGKRRNSSDLPLSTPFPKISYAKLAKATNDFSASYLVGNGRYGSVYKGNLEDYQSIVAIKVFHLEVHGAFKTFAAECDALRSMRHRNLVKILTSCSSIDHQGKDFKALIFEFMQKGNLDTWLHHEHIIDGEDVLSLEKRMDIIINVAEALEYLHHSCEPPIIHCDIKPNNILLDNNMIAHIGDFGLSRILSEAASPPLQDYSNKSQIIGTIGYIAPEYGQGARPSTFADVYSFGVIILEILTGKRPTDDIFKDNLNICDHAKMAFPHKISKIIDPKMLAKHQRDANESSCQSIYKCLLSLTEIGLLCSASLPEERPSMRYIATKLHAIRTSYIQSDGNKEYS